MNNQIKNSQHSLFQQRILPAIFMVVGLIFIFVLFRLSFFGFPNFNWSSSSDAWKIVARLLSLIIYVALGIWAFYELTYAFTQNKIIASILGVLQLSTMFTGYLFFFFISNFLNIQNKISYNISQLIYLYSDWIYYLFLLLNTVIFAFLRLITTKDIIYSNFFVKVLIYFIFSFLISSFFKAFVLLMAVPSGLSYILILMTAASASDIGGFVFGAKFGNKYFKRKLAPTISPKKTWEGFFGGMIVSIATIILLSIILNFADLTSQQDNKNYFSVLFKVFVAQDNSILSVLISKFSLILFTLLVPAIATLGDLSFSMIKRANNIKDFSKVLKGHGGLLDRIDSIIFVFVIFSFVAIGF